MKCRNHYSYMPYEHVGIVISAKTSFVTLGRKFAVLWHILQPRQPIMHIKLFIAS